MDSAPPVAAPPTRRSALGAVLAVVTGAVLTTLLITVVYGLTAEYGDTGRSAAETATGAFGDWAVGMSVAAAPALLALLLARRTSRPRAIAVAACVVVGALVVGVPAGAVLGVQAKYERYEAAPNCTDGFTAGPALPVTRAAQRGFESIDHPGPFGGGGSSGVDGCSTQVMARDHVDVRGHYRTALPANGWRVVTDDTEVLRALHGRQAFELTRDDSGWWVWIGPSRLQERPLPEGVVGPRRDG